MTASRHKLLLFELTIIPFNEIKLTFLARNVTYYTTKTVQLLTFREKNVRSDDIQNWNLLIY